MSPRRTSTLENTPMTRPPATHRHPTCRCTAHGGQGQGHTQRGTEALPNRYGSASGLRKGPAPRRQPDQIRPRRPTPTVRGSRISHDLPRHGGAFGVAGATGAGLQQVLKATLPTTQTPSVVSAPGPSTVDHSIQRTRFLHHGPGPDRVTYRPDTEPSSARLRPCADWVG